MSRDEFAVLDGAADVVAPRLLGCELVRVVNGRTLRGRIVETEAYDQTDAASHSYRGRTPRTDVMFGPSGRLYVYFTYGMHYCCNVVVAGEGHGAAVLIRALEPLECVSGMAAARHKPEGSVELTNGPAKLCQALYIDRQLNGHDLTAPGRPGVGNGIWLESRPPLRADEIVQTTRIGIAQAKEVPWRFYIRGNRYVSKV